MNNVLLLYELFRSKFFVLSFSFECVASFQTVSLFFHFPFTNYLVYCGVPNFHRGGKNRKRYSAIVYCNTAAIENFPKTNINWMLSTSTHYTVSLFEYCHSSRLHWTYTKLNRIRIVMIIYVN